MNRGTEGTNQRAAQHGDTARAIGQGAVKALPGSTPGCSASHAVCPPLRPHSYTTETR